MRQEYPIATLTNLSLERLSEGEVHLWLAARLAQVRAKGLPVHAASVDLQ